jgi:hypothetical protein
LSDIFKKIRSIESEEQAVAQALGLRPETDDAAETSPSHKPLNLTVPDEEDILDLDHLALDEMDTSLDPQRNPILDIDKKLPSDSKETRLGLTPILPVKKPVPSPAAETSTAPKPAPSLTSTSHELPDFMKSNDAEIADPKVLKEELKATLPRHTLEKIEQQVPKADTYGEYGPAPAASMTRFATIFGIVAALLWLVCVGLMMSELLGRTGAWASMTAVQKLGFTVMVLFPLALIGLTTYAFRHLSRLSHASDKLHVTAEALMRPDDTVITRSTIMAKSIQAQVDEVNLKVSSALTRMELLDDMVKSQGSSLAKSTLAIDSTASDVEHRLTTQREGLETISTLFEGRMSQLSAMLDGHTSQLSTSGQLAEQRVQEARLSVEGAAEKLASASETVRQNAVEAAQTLSGSQAEITQLGQNVQEQSTRLDAIYRQHLNDLKVMLTDLRQQQDVLGATMEERLSKMRDMSMSAKVGAENLTEASVKGRETVEALNKAASLTDTAVRARFSEMEEMVKYSTARAESISETATRKVQNSLSTTRKEIARIEADMMDLMDKLGRAEAVRPVAMSSYEPAPPLQESSKQTDLPSMEYRDIVDREIKADNTAQPIEEPVFTLRRPIDASIPPLPSVQEQSESDLDIYPVETDDLPATLRRPSGEPASQDRGKWSLRGLFGSGDSLDIPEPQDISDEDIIKQLTTLGLTPAAIVDDGCIIEASNTRMVKGASAMSDAVAKRLSSPVSHLFKSLEMNATLKSDITTFAKQFSDKLSSLEGDREALRKKFESDAGRAYLLCDAALNAS